MNFCQKVGLPGFPGHFHAPIRTAYGLTVWQVSIKKLAALARNLDVIKLFHWDARAVAVGPLSQGRAPLEH